MAEEIKPDSSSKMIFKNIVFFMRPCKERQDLRPVIEKEGGKITSKASSDCYKLAEKGSLVSREGYITTEFVEDCVKERKLLLTDKYKVKPGTIARPDPEMSFLDCDSDDSMEHASTIIKTSAKDWKGRSKYTKEEDIAMMAYLIEEQKYHEAMGKKVWKEMEALKITDHTAESMGTHYRKYILQNLDKYKRDIDKSWISKLSGYVEREKKESEFSIDALFTKRKKQLLEMVSTTSKDKAQNKDGSGKVQLKSINPVAVLVHSEKTKTDVSKAKTEKTVNDITGPNKGTDNTNTGKQTTARDKSEEDIIVLSDGRLTNKMHYQGEFENFITSIKLKKRDRDVDKTIDDISDAMRKKLRSSVSPQKPCSQGHDTSQNQSAKSKNSNRSAVEVVMINSSSDTEDVVTFDHVASSPDSVDNMLSRYLNDCQKMKENQIDTSQRKHASPKKSLNKNEVKNTNKNYEEKTQSSNNKSTSVDKTKSVVDKIKYIDKTKVVESPVAKRTRHSLTNEKDESKSKGIDTANADLDPSKVKKGTESRKENHGHSKESQENVGAPKRLTRAAAKVTHGNIHINLSASDDETGSEKSDGDPCPRNSQKQTEDSDKSLHTEDNSKVKEVATICKAIAEDYDVSAGYVKHLLYGFSGDVNKAVYWLNYGPDLADNHPWTDSDDERLSGNTYGYLYNKHGRGNVAERLLFLEGL